MPKFICFIPSTISAENASQNTASNDFASTCDASDQLASCANAYPFAVAMTTLAGKCILQVPTPYRDRRILDHTEACLANNAILACIPDIQERASTDKKLCLPMAAIEVHFPPM